MQRKTRAGKTDLSSEGDQKIGNRLTNKKNKTKKKQKRIKIPPQTDVEGKRRIRKKNKIPTKYKKKESNH